MHTDDKIEDQNAVFHLFFIMDITQLAHSTLSVGPGPDRVSFWRRSAPTDSRTMAGRPELCLSGPGEREPEPPHRATNLTNGQLRLRSHKPKLLQEGPEK